MSKIKDLMNSRSILITGGCGFIGANLVNFLLRKGFNYIRILDNLTTGTQENLEDAIQENGEISSRRSDNKIIYKLKNIFNENIQNNFIIDLIIGDIKSYECCLKASKNIDFIVHLAAHAGVIPSIEDPFYDFEVNAKGTLNILHASVKNGVDKFIFASSNAPLGNQNPPMNEKKVPKPLSPYGASKLTCEGYCSAFYSSYGLKSVSFRFSNVYGPYCLHESSVIAKFIKDGLMKKTLTIYGDGEQTRDFIHVNDLCQAIYLILTTSFYNTGTFSLTPTVWGEVFHLGTGKETSIIKLANKLKGLFKNNIKILFEPERKGEIKKNYSDISRSKKMLRYKPKITLEEGLKNTFEWFKNRFKEK